MAERAKAGFESATVGGSSFHRLVRLLVFGVAEADKLTPELCLELRDKGFIQHGLRVRCRTFAIRSKRRSEIRFFARTLDFC